MVHRDLMSPIIMEPRRGRGRRRPFLSLVVETIDGHRTLETATSFASNYVRA